VLNSTSDISKHPEDSNIHSLTDSDHYRTRSETSAPINPSMFWCSECSGLRVWTFGSLRGITFLKWGHVTTVVRSPQDKIRSGWFLIGGPL